MKYDGQNAEYIDGVTARPCFGCHIFFDAFLAMYLFKTFTTADSFEIED